MRVHRTLEAVVLIAPDTLDQKLAAKRATGMLNKTIREALRSDPGSVPLLAEKLEQRQPWADALLGWIMLAFAATLVLLALFEEPWERMRIFQAAIVPAVIGITVLVYCRIMAPKPGA